MPSDPRFDELANLVARATIAAAAHDENTILESLYHLREKAWDINSDILAKRWERRQVPEVRRIPRTPVIPTTVDDLLV
jgi:hypothetical protein